MINSIEWWEPWIRSHIEWSEERLGVTSDPVKRVGGLTKHIRKELLEIEQDPTDLSEYADIVILATDIAWRGNWFKSNQAHEIAWRFRDKIKHRYVNTCPETIEKIMMHLEYEQCGVELRSILGAEELVKWSYDKVVAELGRLPADFFDALEKKQWVNRNRKHPPKSEIIEGEPIEHIRSEAA